MQTSQIKADWREDYYRLDAALNTDLEWEMNRQRMSRLPSLEPPEEGFWQDCCEDKLRLRMALTCAFLSSGPPKGYASDSGEASQQVQAHINGMCTLFYEAEEKQSWRILQILNFYALKLISIGDNPFIVEYFCLDTLMRATMETEYNWIDHIAEVEAAAFKFKALVGMFEYDKNFFVAGHRTAFREFYKENAKFYRILDFEPNLECRIEFVHKLAFLKDSVATLQLSEIEVEFLRRNISHQTNYVINAMIDPLHYLPGPGRLASTFISCAETVCSDDDDDEEEEEEEEEEEGEEDDEDKEAEAEGEEEEAEAEEDSEDQAENLTENLAPPYRDTTLLDNVLAKVRQRDFLALLLVHQIIYMAKSVLMMEERFKLLLAFERHKVYQAVLPFLFDDHQHYSEEAFHKLQHKKPRTIYLPAQHPSPKIAVLEILALPVTSGHERSLRKTFVEAMKPEGGMSELRSEYLKKHNILNALIRTLNHPEDNFCFTEVLEGETPILVCHYNSVSRAVKYINMRRVLKIYPDYYQYYMGSEESVTWTKFEGEFREISHSPTDRSFTRSHAAELLRAFFDVNSMDSGDMSRGDFLEFVCQSQALHSLFSPLTFGEALQLEETAQVDYVKRQETCLNLLMEVLKEKRYGLTFGQELINQFGVIPFIEDYLREFLVNENASLCLFVHSLVLTVIRTCRTIVETLTDLDVAFVADAFRDVWLLLLRVLAAHRPCVDGFRHGNVFTSVVLQLFLGISKKFPLLSEYLMMPQTRTEFAIRTLAKEYPALADLQNPTLKRRSLCLLLKNQKPNF